MDLDETCITILDNTGELEDVDALLSEDYCHIRQFNERTQRFEVITLTSEMHLKLVNVFNLLQSTYDITVQPKKNKSP